MTWINEWWLKYEKVFQKSQIMDIVTETEAYKLAITETEFQGGGV